MRKYFFLFCFSIVSFFLLGQSVVGVNYRIGRSSLIDQNSTGTLKDISSFGLGIGMKLPINSWNQLNVQINIDSKGAYFYIRDIYFKINYYCIPVYYGFEFFNKRISISPGLYFGFSIQSYGFLANTRPRYFYHFKRVDYGFTYLTELNILNYKKFKLELIHSLSYGIPSAYNIDNSPRITIGPTNFIRNFKYDFGMGLEYRFSK